MTSFGIQKTNVAARWQKQKQKQRRKESVKSVEREERATRKSRWMEHEAVAVAASVDFNVAICRRQLKRLKKKNGVEWGVAWLKGQYKGGGGR